MVRFELYAICFFWVYVNIDANLIDLTHELREGIPVFPGQQKFNITNNRVVETPIWYSARDFCTGEHVGTHMDAPFHFNKDRWKVNEIPMERLIAPAVVVNISQRAVLQSGAELQLEDLVEWEQSYGPIPNGSIIFLYSGWGAFWNDPEKYLGSLDNAEDTINPGFSLKAAEWLLQNRDIVGIGVDSASVDSSSKTSYAVHSLLSGSNVYMLENVANLELLPPSGAVIYAFPLKIKDGTGAPARILARIV